MSHKIKIFIMKKSFLIIALFSIVSFTYSCRDAETKPDTVVIEKEVNHDVKVEDDHEGLLEKAGSKVDHEVNKEVSKEIDKIGDDN